jgi:CTP-dependent riboflavin kinase
MKVLLGVVAHGFGCASPIVRLVEERTRLTNLVPGTLNLHIPNDYIVTADALIQPEEYPLNRISGARETIKLQRCVVRGRRAIIMRPDTHETFGWGHGTKHLELMGAVNFRDEFGLTDGATLEVEVDGDDGWWATAT